MQVDFHFVLIVGEDIVIDTKSSVIDIAYKRKKLLESCCPFCSCLQNFHDKS